jgi:hypothetical protein
MAAKLPKPFDGRSPRIIPNGRGEEHNPKLTDAGNYR